MIIDSQLVLSENQAFTTAATTAATNVIDFGRTGRRIGDGYEMEIQVSVDVTAGGTTPTVQFQLFLDDTDGATTVRWSSQTYAAAAIVAGAKFAVPVPQGLAGRYLGLKYVVGGTSPTMTLTAVLVTGDGLQNEVVYPSGYTVS
jgi:hypothetical protein